MTVPSGQVIIWSSPEGKDFGSVTIENGRYLGGEGFEPGPFLLLGESTHHLIALRNPDTGIYSSRVGALRTSDVTVRAALRRVKAMKDTLYSDVLDPNIARKASQGIP